MGERKVQTGTAVRRNGGGGDFFGGINPKFDPNKDPWPDATFADEDGTETIPAYECVEGCPVAELDRQSGPAGSNSGTPWNSDGSLSGGNWGRGERPNHDATHAYDTRDAGGASRFFYVAKASKDERNDGLREFPVRPVNAVTFGGKTRECNVCGSRSKPPGVITDDTTWPRCGHGDWRWVEEGASHKGDSRNVHPTVKPVELMRYLIRLVTPPDGTVLDPFTGSGSTIVAAIREGMKSIGIELTTTDEAPYFRIACARAGSAHKYLAEPQAMF